MIPLNAVVMEHLRAIRGNRELLFEQGMCKESFRKHFIRLLRLAGIPYLKRFVLHDLRRTCATVLWQTAPEAAQLMLGHASIRMTRQFYVNSPASIKACAAIGGLRRYINLLAREDTCGFTSASGGWP